MAVHYQFKSANVYDSISFEGPVISVVDLKQAIIDQKKLGKAADFDLKFSNAQTGEEYIRDSTSIPKNTSIIVKRVPILRTFGVMVNQNDPNAKPGAGYKFPTVQKNIETRQLPANYICHRCHKPGHFINMCPTNGDPKYDKVKKSTGIPKTFLKQLEGATADSGALMMPGGGLAVLQHNSARFDEEVQSMERKQTARDDIPDELKCPICKGLLRDVVLTSCCGVNFCDNCIRRAIFDDLNSCCPNCKKPGTSAKNFTPDTKVRQIIEKRNNLLLAQALTPNKSYGENNNHPNNPNNDNPRSNGPSRG